MADNVNNLHMREIQDQGNRENRQAGNDGDMQNRDNERPRNDGNMQNWDNERPRNRGQRQENGQPRPPRWARAGRIPRIRHGQRRLCRMLFDMAYVAEFDASRTRHPPRVDYIEDPSEE